jgi:hypothetical protein
MDDNMATQRSRRRQGNDEDDDVHEDLLILDFKQPQTATKDTRHFEKL